MDHKTCHIPFLNVLALPTPNIDHQPAPHHPFTPHLAHIIPHAIIQTRHLQRQSPPLFWRSLRHLLQHLRAHHVSWRQRRHHWSRVRSHQSITPNPQSHHIALIRFILTSSTTVPKVSKSPPIDWQRQHRPNASLVPQMFATSTRSLGPSSNVSSNTARLITLYAVRSLIRPE